MSVTELRVKIKQKIDALPPEQLEAAAELIDDLAEEELTPEHEAYLRREVQKGIEQLDSGQYADFDAEKVIAERRSRLAQEKGGK